MQQRALNFTRVCSRMSHAGRRAAAAPRELCAPAAALLHCSDAGALRPAVPAPRPRRTARLSTLAPPAGSTPHHIAWLSSVEFAEGSGRGSNGSGENGSGGGPESRVRGARAIAALQRAELDAVVMLAGGLLPDGGLPEWVTRRLDTAYDVHLLQRRRCPILLLGGGTPHKPAVVGPTGHVVHESTSCASYLMERGAAAGDLLKESASYDTVGNAYFSLTIHAIPADWRRVAVVTSEFHMPRTRALFDGVWRMAGESVYGDPHRFKLVYVSSSDHGVFDADVYQARIDKEAEAVANWKRASAQLSSLADFHAWFFSDHLCYAVPKQHMFGVRTIKDDRLLASY